MACRPSGSSISATYGDRLRLDGRQTKVASMQSSDKTKSGSVEQVALVEAIVVVFLLFFGVVFFGVVVIVVFDPLVASMQSSDKTKSGSVEQLALMEAGVILRFFGVVFGFVVVLFFNFVVFGFVVVVLFDRLVGSEDAVANKAAAAIRFTDLVVTPMAIVVVAFEQANSNIGLQIVVARCPNLIEGR
jgi:hypothetical protein